MRFFQIIFLLLPFYMYSQSNPSLDEVSRAITEVKNFELTDNPFAMNAKESDINKKRFVYKNFTDLNREECLAIIPMESGRHYSEWLVLMYKNLAGNWVYADWFNLGGYEVDFIDVDSDGVYEIIIKSSTMGQGAMESYYKLISIKNSKEVLLYENSGFNNSAAPFIHKVGNTLYTDYRVRFEKSNSKVYDLLEDIVIGEIELVDDSGEVSRVKNRKETKTYKLKQGAYVVE